MSGRVVFEWDSAKDRRNQAIHQVSFAEARLAFEDPNRLIIQDLAHSQTEPRYFCLGKVARGILTVRFTYRGKRIRIFGAGFWRKGRRRYEEEQRTR
jgi:uncharacterized DUF497 family protein